MKTKNLWIALLISSSAFGQYSYKPIKPSPKSLECKSTIEELNKEFKVYNYSQDFCGNPKSIDAVLNSREELKVCLEQLLKISTTRQNLLGRCQKEEFRNSLKIGDAFTQCVIRSKNMDLGESHLTLCEDIQFQNLLTRPEYLTCLDTHKEAYPYSSMNEISHLCKNPKMMENLNGNSFKKCKQELQNLGIGLIERLRYCAMEKNQSEENLSEIIGCEKKLRNIVGEDFSGSYCLRTKAPAKAFSDKALVCLAEGRSMLEADFFENEENTHTALPLVERILWGCQKPKAPAPISKNPVKFHRAMFFSLNSKFQGTRIGGLSGLDFDEKKNSLYVVSDDPGLRNPSRFYEMKLNLASSFSILPEAVTTLHTSHSAPVKPKEYFDIDAEGIVISSTGETIVSSETLLKGSKSFIKVFDKDGEQINEIILNEKFMPKKERVEKVETYFEYPRDSRTLVFGPDGLPEKPEKVEKTRKTFYEEQVQGILPNKGFESLAGSADASILITANEFPLAQDNLKDRKIVRLVKIIKNKKVYSTQAEFAYELEKGNDNGLVDIVYLNENKVLTLERSYDSYKNKVTAKIFETDLKDARNYSEFHSFIEQNEVSPIEAVSKKLLIDLDEVLPYLPLGLDKIDNIEGITLGPKLPNGNRSLIVVSDNNFSQGQFTQFIVLEYPQQR